MPRGGRREGAGRPRGSHTRHHSNPVAEAPEIISQSEYARRRGVSREAISKAVSEGRIPVNGDGRINPEAADQTWLYRRHQRGEARQAGTAAEARREQALLTSTLAKIQMTRRRVDLLRAQLTERDRGQAAIGALVDRLYTALPGIAEGAAETDVALLREAAALIAADLGDLVDEALRVTRE